MIFYWALVVGLCRCSSSGPAWLYQSENSEDGWSVDDVFPGLYTTDKDGLSTLLIPPHALERTLAYHPVESAKECGKSLLSDDVACYSAYEDTDFNLFPDKAYQVKWLHESYLKNISQHTSVETPQTVAQDPINSAEAPGVSLPFNPTNITLPPIENPSDIRQLENNPPATLSKNPSVQEDTKNRRAHRPSQKASAVVMPTTDLKSKEAVALPPFKDILAIQQSSFSPELTTGPATDRPADTGDQSMSEGLVKRTVWFEDGTIQQASFQSTLSAADPQVAFSQNYMYGVTGPDTQDTYLEGKNEAMGCRMNHNRIIFLDGYKIKDKEEQKELHRVDWSRCIVSRSSLETEMFKAVYPLKKDGLVVALDMTFKGNHQLLMASYGEPPLGAILLRPRGNWLAVVTRTFDDTVKSVKVHHGDIVVIGPLLGISNLGLGRLLFSISDTPGEIAKSVYDSAAEASLCVVATISVIKSPQPKVESVPHRSVESLQVPSSGATLVPWTMNYAQPLSQTKAPDNYESQSSSRVVSERIQSPPQDRSAIGGSPEISNFMKYEELRRRATWFFQNQKLYSLPHIASPDAIPSIAFDQWYYYGVLKPPTEDLSQLSITNTRMGCNITHNRILLLDGCKKNNDVKRLADIDWRYFKLSKSTLEAEALKKSLLLETDGLVVAINKRRSNNHRLIMASYGKPPLGAILLRPKGDLLKVVTRTLDDTVKSLKVRNGDVVVVGPLLGISNVASKVLLLSTSDPLDKIAEKVYGSTKRSLCVVATISVDQ